MEKNWQKIDSSYFLLICVRIFWISGLFYSVAGERSRKNKVQNAKVNTKSGLMWRCAKRAEKARGETVVQKGVFGESVSSLPP